jgi:hypothetical protein
MHLEHESSSFRARQKCSDLQMGVAFVLNVTARAELDVKHHGSAPA